MVKHTFDKCKLVVQFYFGSNIYVLIFVKKNCKYKKKVSALVIIQEWLAQLVEHWPFKLGVIGSSPISSKY